MENSNNINDNSNNYGILTGIVPVIVILAILILMIVFLRWKKKRNALASVR